VTPDSPSDFPASDPKPDLTLAAGDGASEVSPGLFDDDIEARQKTGLRWILISGLVLVLGVGGWLGYNTWQRRRVDPIVVTTASPLRETLENRVDASGVVILGNQQTLKAPNDVTVEQVFVQASEAVTEGEVLLRLRDRELEQQLEEELIQQEILRLDSQRLQEVLQEKQRDVQRAEQRLVESQDLVDQGYISEELYEDDRNRLEMAKAELRNTQVELQKKELEIRQNQAAIANIKARIADNAIVAPFNAIVLEVSAKPGDGVPREGALLTIGDPTEEMVQFDLMTLDANKVSVNMPVRVSVIGPNPIKYSGRVISIAPQAVSGDQNDNQATVQAIARLDEPSGKLIPGGAVSIEIILTQRQDVLSVPLGTLQQEDGEPFVWVVDAAGKAQKRPVETGLETLDAVEIISGLEEIDEIIINLPPDQPLTEGMAVTTSEPPGGELLPGADQTSPP
jgi:HlyD family secretion protein